VRGAVPGFRDPLTPARLLALAARDGVESRLVRERWRNAALAGDSGPLPAGLIRRLGPSHWTVLVQHVDAHVAAVADLIDLFDFLPRWRVDDVMISLAAPQGSVGPSRRQLRRLPAAGPRPPPVAGGRALADKHVPGLDLRILRGFRAERDWVLDPGDMLYLPPGVAHHGVALEECLTYSIGFRAPSQYDLVAGFLQRVVAAVDRSRLYADPDLSPARDPGEITASGSDPLATHREGRREGERRRFRPLRGRTPDRTARRADPAAPPPGSRAPGAHAARRRRARATPGRAQSRSCAAAG
jgi:50S ribosomal protein L16 3-hydroxylase